MKGGIYPTKSGYQVRFGRKLTKRFRSLVDAERFLNYIRHQTDIGTFDIRDHQRSNPLGFATLADKWLKLKKKQVKPRSFDNLQRHIGNAVKAWDQTNVKHIGFGEIEDFLFERTDISEKTRSDIRSCLHNFFKWVSNREDIPMPKFPDVPYELEWRNIVDIPTQQNILAEVRRISYHINPKIWTGIHFLSTYISVRPSELISIRERQINLKMGAIIFPHPKEKQPKLVYLLDEDIELFKSIPRGLPDLYFFRHVPGIKGATAGKKFSRKYLYAWCKRACENLGIEEVSLYGIARHSTATALGQICTPEKCRDATGHKSPAFDRYFQGKPARALKVTQKIKELSDKSVINILGH